MIPLDVQCISSDHLLVDTLAYHICTKSLIKACAHLKAAMIYFHIDPSQLMENKYAKDWTYITYFDDLKEISRSQSIPSELKFEPRSSH